MLLLQTTSKRQDSGESSLALSAFQPDEAALRGLSQLDKKNTSGGAESNAYRCQNSVEIFGKAVPFLSNMQTVNTYTEMVERARRHTVLYTNMQALHFNTNNHCSGNKAYFVAINSNSLHKRDLFKIAQTEC